MTAAAITEFRNENAWASNFRMRSFTYWGDGITYPSREHCYHAQKSADLKVRLRIAQLPTARDAKRAGRQLTLIPDWDVVKKRAMNDLVLCSFWVLPEERELLVATGDRPLVEGNHWHDNFWGMCWCPGCAAPSVVAENYDPAKFHTDAIYRRLHPGKNYLGRILMSVRDIVRED